MRKRQRKKNARKPLCGFPRRVAVALISHILVGTEAFRLAFGCDPTECGIVGNRITFTRR